MNKILNEIREDIVGCLLTLSNETLSYEDRVKLVDEMLMEALENIDKAIAGKEHNFIIKKVKNKNNKPTARTITFERRITTTTTTDSDGWKIYDKPAKLNI